MSFSSDLKIAQMEMAQGKIHMSADKIHDLTAELITMNSNTPCGTISSRVRKIMLELDAILMESTCAEISFIEIKKNTECDSVDILTGKVIMLDIGLCKESIKENLAPVVTTLAGIVSVVVSECENMKTDVFSRLNTTHLTDDLIENAKGTYDSCSRRITYIKRVERDLLWLMKPAKLREIEYQIKEGSVLEIANEIHKKIEYVKSTME